MKVLFVHNNFPAQFVHIARALVQLGHETVFLSEFCNAAVTVEGLRPIQVSVPPLEKNSNPALQSYLAGLKRAEMFANVCMALRKQGFSPDVIIDHPAWGAGLYLGDIFPQAARLSYFEWFFTKQTQSLFTGQDFDAAPTLFAEQRQRNNFLLQALQDADWAIAPTQWQCRQIPANFHYKMQVMHEGIDTGYFSPDLSYSSYADIQTLVPALPPKAEIVTYAARGFEPYRGFPQFYSALKGLLEARPLCHVICMGDDRVCYGSPRADGKGWAHYLQETLPLGELAARLHFLPFQSTEAYRTVLRASTAHVYLTVPFVLSWSLLEAMSCGCLVIGADVAPVREVIEHGANGFLTPLGNSDALVDSLLRTLEHAPHLHSVREAARERVIQRYELGMQLSQHLGIIEDVLRRKQGKGIFL